jgi:hypothetical protein
VIKLNLMRGRIPLTQGQVAKVDEADWEELSRHKWQALWAPNTQSFYAVRGVRVGDGGHKEIMSRRIMGLQREDRRQVDHRSHDTLDNRKSNLRITTPRGNQENRKNQSVHGPGVDRLPSGLYRAHAWVGEQRRHIGVFAIPEEAQAARKAWLQERGLA